MHTFWYKNMIKELCIEMERTLLKLSSQKEGVNSIDDAQFIGELIESGTVIFVALKEIDVDKGMIGSIKKMLNGKVVVDNANSYLEDALLVIKHYDEVIDEQ